MKKALVLGGNGFLGRYIYNYLVNKSIKVFAPRSRTIFDLLSYDTIENYHQSVVKDNFFDYIFHCAVYFEPGNFKNDANNFLYNEIMNLNVIRYFKEYQRQAKFITFGSDAAYDDRYNLNEPSYLYGFPNSDYYGYALSKRNLYQSLQLLENIDYLHLPIITLYGSSYRKDDNHLIHSIIKKIIRAKYYNEEAVFWGNGCQIREIVFVNDLISNINSLIDKNATGIFNLGSENKRNSISYYVKIICEKLDYDPYKCVWDESAKSGLFSKSLNNDKAIKYIGKENYKDTKFEDSLDDIIKYSLELYKTF